MSFLRHRNLFKLRVTDNNCIIVTGSDSTAELFTVLGFKILLGCNKDISRRIQLQIFTCPLACEVVRNYKHTLLAKSESFAFLSNSNHRKGFTSANNMSQKLVLAIDTTCNCIHLVLTQSDFGIDTHKVQMVAVIFSCTMAIEFLIIHFAKSFTAFGVIPNPLLESILNKFLFTLCNSSFFFIKNCNLVSFFVLNIVEDANITKVQGFFKNFKAIDTTCSIGVICLNVRTVITLALNIPFTGIFRVMGFHIVSHIICHTEKFIHKVINNIGWEPSSTKSNTNLTCSKVSRLDCFKCLNIHGKRIISICFVFKPCNTELFTNITRQILVSSNIFVFIFTAYILEYNTG